MPDADQMRPSVRSLPPDLPHPATASRAGVLHPESGAQQFTLSRPAVCPELSAWVEHHWSVTWSLPEGAAYPSKVLTHPAVHLTFESGTPRHHALDLPAALVHGVVTRRFDVDLRGEGRVFGAKFRPGGFGAFTGRDVAELTDRVVPMAEVFGPEAGRVLEAVLAEESDAVRARVVEGFLLDRAPEPDARYEHLLEIVAVMLADSSLTTVDAVTERCGVSPRTLQRLFRRYVGVGPKWVLRRFRLHDAVTLLDSGSGSGSGSDSGSDSGSGSGFGHEPDLATVAAELGWYDQAHFTRDFTDTVGVPPGAYLEASRSAAVVRERPV
jgi:AraC-like DNA-binding protein